MRCHALLQGISLTQGSNPGLLQCRRILYRLTTRDAQRDESVFLTGLGLRLVRAFSGRGEWELLSTATGGLLLWQPLSLQSPGSRAGRFSSCGTRALLL